MNDNNAFGSRSEKARCCCARAYRVLTIRLRVENFPKSFGYQPQGSLSLAAIESYLDSTFEPERRLQIADVLWRCIRGRGGQRGYRQKLRHITEGLDQNHYSNSHPFVNPDSGHQYAADWKFAIVEEVLKGGDHWEVESLSSEESIEVRVIEPPTAKAKGESSSPVEASSSSSSAPTSKARPVIRPTKADRLLQPRSFLPDTVLWFDPSATSSFAEVPNYSSFDGYKNYITSSAPAKFVLFLDYHQVLDRSYSESVWNTHQIPQDNIRFLRVVKEAGARIWGNSASLIIFVLSHIENSSRNLEGLVRACNDTEVIRTENLINGIFITRQRCGALGKLATAKSITHQFEIPSCIIDDNVDVIGEFAEVQEENPVHTCHIKLRRKPSQEKAEIVRQFLVQCTDPVEQFFRRYQQ